MPVPSSGELKLWDAIWNDEIGGSKGDNSLHSASIYAGFSTPDAMSDFYGWSDVEAPSVTSSAATSVTQSSMTINGNVTSLGGAANVTRGFYFGTSTTYTSNTKYTLSGTQGTGAFSRSMTGLSAGTTYYFNAWAANSAGETVSNQTSRTTFVNFSPSLRNYWTHVGQVGSFNAPQNRSAHTQHHNPNIGYITYQGQTNLNNYNMSGTEYNNTRSRGYTSAGFPQASCPSAKTNAWATLAHQRINSANYDSQTGGHGGGSGDICAFGQNHYPEGNAYVGGQYYVVFPVHWADLVYSAHAVGYVR